MAVRWEGFFRQKDPVIDVGKMRCILAGDQSRDGVRVISFLFDAEFF